MKTRITVIVTLVSILLCGSAFSNGLSLNSIGPKAFGMGGAFVGLANDYTAIYWNPAGLSQMQKNYIGVFVTDIIPIGTYKLPAAAIDAKTKTNHYLAPNFMAAYRIEASEKLTVGLGVYVPAGLGTEWDGDELKNLAGGSVNEWMTFIRVVDISPAASYKFSDQFSAGMAIHIYYGMFDLKKPGGGGKQYSENSSGWAVGPTFSILYKPNNKASVGLSMRTRTWMKMSGSAENPLLPLTALAVPATSDFTRDVGWPMWIAAGFSYKATEKLTLAFDLQYSQWSQSENEIGTRYDDPKWAAIPTRFPALANAIQSRLVMRWRDATQIRFGADYMVDESLNLRCGYYFDPAPAPDQTLNVLFPSATYHGFTLGVGYKMNSFVFDIAGEYLFGSEREIIAGAMPGVHGMNIPAFSLGVGYEF